MSLAANDVAIGSQSVRNRMLWLLLAIVAAGQLFAFWLVCSHQVRLAETRRNEAVVQQMALSDCLQYIPGSTIASCSARDTAQVVPAGGHQSALNGAMPVSFTYR